MGISSINIDTYRYFWISKVSLQFVNFVHIAHNYNNFGRHSLAGYMQTTMKPGWNNEIGTDHEQCVEVNISIAHILDFFLTFWKYPSSIFFEHVVDEFLKTNLRLVLQETRSPRSLGAFCPLRRNFCPFWRNYRTLWWNHDAVPYTNGTVFNGFLECGRRFTLRLNTAKSTNYIEKCFKQKLFKIKFPTKKQWTHISISSSSGARGLQRRIPMLVHYISKIANVCAPCSIPGRVRDMRSLSFL